MGDEMTKEMKDSVDKRLFEFLQSADGTLVFHPGRSMGIWPLKKHYIIEKAEELGFTVSTF